MIMGDETGTRDAVRGTWKPCGGWRVARGGEITTNDVTQDWINVMNYSFPIGFKTLLFRATRHAPRATNKAPRATKKFSS